MADDEQDAIKRFTLLVLLQAQEDRASELIISSSSSSSLPIKYKVEEDWYSLSPPPPHIVPKVLSELARLAGLRGEVLPAKASIDVPFSGTHLRWKIQLSNTDAHCFPIPP
jgi:hypothetical protein